MKFDRALSLQGIQFDPDLWMGGSKPTENDFFAWNTYNAPQLRQYTTDFHNLGCKSIQV